MALKEITPKLSKTAKSLLSEVTGPINISNLSWMADDVQGALSIVDIQDGLIFTSTGSVVSIVEIIPINYLNLDDSKQDSIATHFGSAFKRLPDKGHFKAMSIQTNLENYDARLREYARAETSDSFKKRVDDYLKVLHLYQKSETSIATRFFYIFEYEESGENGATDRYEDVLRYMRQTQRDIITTFHEMGNVAIDMQKDIVSLAEVFYQFYNPKTSGTEVLNQRITKVSSVAHWFGQKACLKDYVCPRGIRYGKWDYMVIDGVYQTYYVLRENAFPSEVVAGWLITLLSQTVNGDLDIFYRKNVSTLNDFMVDRAGIIAEGISHTYDNTGSDKQDDYVDKAFNARAIKKLRKSGEDVYDVSLIVTLRANSFDELESKKTSFKKKMSSLGLTFDTCYLKTHEFFDMVTPLCDINSRIFKTHCRNMTNTGLSSLYMFASSDLFEQNGYWIGSSVVNGSLVAFNNFNTKRYTNPHITIVGKTGSGKTVAMLHITNVMRMHGVRTMYILPYKGHEYTDNIKSMGGEFIPLFSPDVCINICEIRPSELINEENCKDNEERLSLLNNSESLLALKVEFLVNWFRIQLDPEERLSSAEIGELNSLLVHMYNERGITDDNLSIFKEVDGAISSELKKMPIIEDIYKLVVNSPTLKRLGSLLKPWVEGSHKHMNGQTNVSLNNKCIAFDVDEDKLGRYLPAFMLIAFEFCYSIARRDLDEKCCISLDETWKFLSDVECTKYIRKMEKILRSYSTGIICATQQVSDCSTDDAMSMFSMPDIKIILKSSKDDLPLIRKIVSLSESEGEELERFMQGTCFFCEGSNKIKIQIDPTLYELYLDEPKASAKAEYLKKMEMGYLINVS